MILLDMKMPENCWRCPMQRYAVRSDKYICVITGKLAEEIEERSAFCPIKAEIPKNATNGDVIKAMFPNLTVETIDTDEYTNKPKTVEISVEKGMHILTTISADVWNAPWKGVKK